VKCRAKRRSLAVATRWWLLKALIRQLNSAEQARVTRLQPSAPPPWPPRARPIFLAHFLHPPGGSLHYSVPESGCRRMYRGAVDTADALPGSSRMPILAAAEPNVAPALASLPPSRPRYPTAGTQAVQGADMSDASAYMGAGPEQLRLPYAATSAVVTCRLKEVKRLARELVSGTSAP